MNIIDKGKTPANFSIKRFSGVLIMIHTREFKLFPFCKAETSGYNAVTL